MSKNQSGKPKKVLQSAEKPWERVRVNKEVWVSVVCIRHVDVSRQQKKEKILQTLMSNIETDNKKNFRKQWIIPNDVT